MKELRYHFFKKLHYLCLAGVIVISGCATTNPHSFNSTVPEEVSNQIKHVLVVPAQFVPQMNYHPIGRYVMAAEGISSGVEKGVVSALLFPLESGDGFAIILIPILLPVGAVIGGVVGGIWGAANAVPHNVADQIEELVDSTLVNLDIQSTMAENILEAGQELTDYKYTILKGIGPTSHEEIFDYSTLNLEDTEIVVEVRVISLGLKGGKGDNPLISLSMNVNAKVVDVTSGEEIYSNLWNYLSRERPLIEWAENNAQPLHDELGHCYRSLAEDIVETMFLMH